VQLPDKISDWEPFWVELMEERAAIFEFEAHMSRYAAFKLAEQDTRRTAEQSE
jgi:hypothetical protein